MGIKKLLRSNVMYKAIVDEIYRLIINPLDRRKKANASREVLESKGARDIFEVIHRKNLWGSSESISGTGSTLAVTKELRSALEQLFSDLETKSVLDLPCGDFNWMKFVNLDNISYVGGDIVGDIIARNKMYETDHIKFLKIDIVRDRLPDADLILVRDCFVHLAFPLISEAIANIKRSNIKYLLTTTFIDKPSNEDIVTGLWRPLNLEQAPFHFPKPVRLLADGTGGVANKCLGLWRIDEL